MSIFLNRKKYYLVIFLYSLFAILFAIYIEFILGYVPCKLCLYQRLPFVITLFVSFVGLNYSEKNSILIFLIVLFTLSTLISGYHFGIENGIFVEFLGCLNNNTNLIDKTEILKSLNNMPIKCKDVDFKLLGLSLSGINFLLSFIFIIYSLRTLIYEKN